MSTGFSDAALVSLARQLARLEQTAACLTVDQPAADLRGARWVTPKLVGEIAYSEITHTGTLRHPRWKVLRPDITVDDLVERHRRIVPAVQLRLIRLRPRDS